METAAITLLVGLGVILTVHYFQGGTEQVKTYANYALTGRGTAGGYANRGSRTASSSTSEDGGGGLMGNVGAAVDAAAEAVDEAANGTPLTDSILGSIGNAVRRPLDRRPPRRRPSLNPNAAR